MMKDFLLFLTVALSLVAGCGGNSDKKANEAYANSICTAIDDWAQNVKTLATDFSAGITEASLNAKASQFETETEDLASELKSISPPDTDEGDAAKQQLAQLSTDLSNTVEAVKSGLAAIQANPSAVAIAAAVAAVKPQLETLVDTSKAAVSSLQQAGGSLADEFKKADSCESLGSG
jgi:hypothetical protein